MELFGTVCTVVGVGTLSAGVMRIIYSIHEIFHLCKGEFDVFHKIAGER